MKLRPLLALMSLSSLLFAFAQGEPLKVGDAAPAVTATTETGAKLALAEVYAKQAYTLVYFYPKADTPGCTAQGCSLRDAYEELTKAGVAVLGVSTDGPAAQAKFKDGQHFPFTLVADADKTVINAFGVPTRAVPAMGEFAARQAYLIKGGKIIWADYKAKTKEQAADVLKVLAAQKG